MEAPPNHPTLSSDLAPEAGMCGDCRAFDKFFGLWDFGPMPAKIRYVCCAQFVVGAQRIRHRPKAFYIAAKEYLLDNDIRGAWSGFLT